MLWFTVSSTLPRLEDPVIPVMRDFARSLLRNRNLAPFFGGEQSVNRLGPLNIDRISTGIPGKLMENCTDKPARQLSDNTNDVASASTQKG